MRPARFLPAGFAAACFAVLLAGCGFTPLYATPGLADGLSRIDVVAPHGRVGYLLAEDLDDGLARNRTSGARWRLTMQVVETRAPRGLSLSDVAQYYVLGVTVRYTLNDLATGRAVHSGEVVSQVNYDATDQPYAAIAARQDGQQRLASDAARKIQMDLSLWLASQSRG
ncbi:MAG: LPS assembly lipoprotein LptE [Caulobacteraceae bacterium]